MSQQDGMKDGEQQAQAAAPVPGAPPSAQDYDAWYGSARGAWIGEREYRLLTAVAAPRAGESVLDVGAGTGYFTRRFAGRAHAGRTVAADLDFAAARYAAQAGGQPALVADARRLPFPDHSFDLVLSVTALCFVPDIETAIAEMRRIARRRIALGLLNRDSSLYRAKHGSGAYRGARWHRPGEVEQLLRAGTASEPALRTGVMLASGGPLARRLEPWLALLAPRHGAFIAAAVDVE